MGSCLEAGVEVGFHLGLVFEDGVRGRLGGACSRRGDGSLAAGRLGVVHERRGERMMFGLSIGGRTWSVR